MNYISEARSQEHNVENKQIAERYMPPKTCKQYHILIMNMFICGNHTKHVWK